GLRIKARRETLDLLGREGVAADLGEFADVDVFVEFHDGARGRSSDDAGASAARQPNIGFTVSVISLVPFAATSSNRKRTKPISGRLRERRVSSTVARTVNGSPART